MLRPYYYELLAPKLAPSVVLFVDWLVPELPRHYPAKRASKTPSEVFREFSFRYEGVRYYDMARKSTADSKSKPSNGWKPTKWANIRLQDDDVAIIQERCAEQAELVGSLFVLFDDGYDVFIKRRDDGQTVQVSITGLSTRVEGENVGLSAHAPDVFAAISALLFKYHDIAGGVLEDFIGSGAGGIG